MTFTGMGGNDERIADPSAKTVGRDIQNLNILLQTDTWM